MALTTLPEEVQDKIHSAQITLAEAEALTEFADDDLVMKRLLREVGSYNFKFTVEQERRAREKAAKLAEARREFEKTGIRVIERPDGFAWASRVQPIQSFVDPTAEPVDGQPSRFTPVTHAGACPHHAVIVDTYNAEPIHVCTDPAAAGHQSFRRHPLRAEEEERDPEAEAACEAERQRQDQRHEALIVAARVRRSFAEGLVRPSGMKAAEPLLRLAVRDAVLDALNDSDPDEIRALGEMLGVTIPDQIEEWGPVPEAFTQAIQSKWTGHELIGVLFAVRILDYEARGRTEHQWQTDEAFCRYVSLLVDLGYEPSDIERELLGEWPGDDQDAEVTA